MIEAVQNAVLARVAGLGLGLGGVAVPVLKGKAPKQENGESAATQITVHPADRPKEVTRSDNGLDLHAYKVRVTTWSYGNRDNAAGSSDYSAWQDAIEQEFVRAGCRDELGLSEVFDTFAVQGVYLDRGSLAKGWDVQAVDVTVSIVRVRP